MNPESPTAQVSTAWRKSSYSTATGNCVEVAPAVDGVVIRHSKHPAAGTIHFPYHAWTVFVRDACEDGAPGANEVVSIAKAGSDTLVRSLGTEVELRFDAGEWSAFRAGAADGEFDFTSRLAIA